MRAVYAARRGDFMSKATTHGSAAPSGPQLVGDRRAPADEVVAPRQGELAFPAPVTIRRWCRHEW